MHYYRLHLAAPEHHNELNNVLTGPMVEDDKPQMITEAARKIRVPSWWNGPTTISDATMIAENVRKKP